MENKANNPAPTIVVVDFDEAMRRLVKLNLADLYEEPFEGHFRSRNSERGPSLQFVF